MLSLESCSFIVFAQTNETITSWSANGGGIGFPYQKNGFCNNNTFWEFYLNKDDEELHYQYKNSTADDWSEPSNSPVTEDIANETIVDPTDFSVHFENVTGPYVYVGIIIYNTTTLYQSLGYDQVFFRRGTVGDTEITWDNRSGIIEDKATYFGGLMFIDVSVDTSGLPWVTYMDYGSQSYGFGIRATNVNGSGSWEGKLQTPGYVDAYVYPAVIPLENKFMAFVLSTGLQWGAEYIELRIWNETHNGVLNKGDFTDALDVYTEFDCVAINSNVHVAYTNASDYLIYTWWNLTSEVWSANETISSSANQTYPALSRVDSSDLICYLASNNVIYSSRKTGGAAWTSVSPLVSAPRMLENRFSSMYNASEIEDIGVSWIYQGSEELRFYVASPSVFGRGWMPALAIIGLMGLLLFVITPAITVWQVKIKKNYSFLFYSLVLFGVAYAFVVAWIQ